MKTITNYERCKMKWNSKNHKKNERNKHEHCQSSKTNNVQWNENAETQNYARNELITITQFKNQLKAKNNHNEKLWMQDQTNSDRIMNRNLKNSVRAILKAQEVIHEIIRKSNIIKT